MVGFFRNLKVVRYKGVQYLEIHFVKTGDNLHSFAIENVLNEEEMKKELLDRKTRGHYLGLGFTYNYSFVTFNNFRKHFGEYTFERSVLPGNELGLEYRMLFSKTLGMSLGLQYDEFKTAFRTEEFYNQYEPEIDKDEEYFNPIIILENMEQTMSVKTLQIPILLDIMLGEPTKLMPYFSIGLKIKYVTKSEYIFEGIGETQGYYNSYPVTGYEPVVDTEFHEISSAKALGAPITIDSRNIANTKALYVFLVFVCIGFPSYLVNIGF
jgi:hypothetical protein